MPVATTEYVALSTSGTTCTMSNLQVEQNFKSQNWFIVLYLKKSLEYTKQPRGKRLHINATGYHLLKILGNKGLYEYAAARLCFFSKKSKTTFAWHKRKIFEVQLFGMWSNPKTIFSTSKFQILDKQCLIVWAYHKKFVEKNLIQLKKADAKKLVTLRLRPFKPMFSSECMTNNFVNILPNILKLKSSQATIYGHQQKHFLSQNISWKKIDSTSDYFLGKS